MKFYDRKNKRLIMVEQKADSEHWDKHWHLDDFVGRVKAGKDSRLVRKFTKKFLPAGSKILEGGCGIGQNVFGLKYWGYNAYGVDFAQKTVKKIKKNFPELKISVQDVRKLDFPDDFFDGYWSVGVIEHFWEGYNSILYEVKRVIKPEGYFFLTFPHLSSLRKLKAKLGFYKIFKSNSKVNDFYQFILNAEKVKADVEKCGFKLILKHPYNATKGIKDEISLLKPILQKIYDSQNTLAKGIRFLNSILFSKVAGHSILLIFQKK